jgi:extracellular elastinolytic metalloproteinase
MRRVTVAAIAALALVVPAQALGQASIHDHVHEHDTLDARAGTVSPSAAQRSAAERMATSVTWNRFGTPQSLFDANGWLAEGLPGEPAAAARAFLRRNAALFRLSTAEVDALELVNDSPLSGSGAHAVLFRQRFGGLRAAADGLAAVGVFEGKVAYVSSSLTGSGTLEGAQRLTAQEAWLAAARDVGIDKRLSQLAIRDSRAGFGQLQVDGLAPLQQVREVAVPTPRDGVRRAFEANVVDNGPVPEAWTVLVDAETGAVLLRDDRLESAADQPNWRYFENIPPLDGADTDRRIVGCFPAGDAAAAPCTFDERQTEAATPFPWDVIGGAPPTFTTTGNNADTALSALSPFTPGPDRGVRPTSPTRDYLAPWTDAWRNSKCNPAVFAGGIVPATGPDTFGGTKANDVNAAIISLFANHNNMHDWAYDLGFTEQNYNMQVSNFGKGGRQGDPELGDAQGGALAGGSPTYTGRDNANQITFQDGVAPITNMYLWQPIAGAFYPPCVDGDFDMSVIGHEYTHAISNRMVAGPDAGLSSRSDGQARSMGESFSDFTAVEFLLEHGYAPADGENPFSVGAYVTGSKEKGIRNYGMNDSPLNYSDVQGYDGSGMGSPHDDGEIWSAANYDIRQALIAKHGEGSAADQLACARGKRPADQCPGNRRWMQIVFDAYLLMPSRVSMLEARDAYLAADRMRFGGANQQELWTAFARRGFGEKATSKDTNDPDPVPSFESPLRDDEATVTFAPVDESGAPVKAELFVGEYEANVTPVADTDPATPLGASVEMVPGEYAFVARGDGRGAQKFTRTLAAGSDVDLRTLMPANQASRSNGATISGDGANQQFMIDDTEETNWVAADREPNVEGTQVTVKLAGGEQLVDRVQVSALLRAVDEGDDQDDPGNQNRFTALRQFAIETCSGTCAADGDFTRIFTSDPDAFPGDVPRPLAPDMILRGFDVPDTRASHVRIVVLTNQCTGNPVFKDETLENDPTSESDCTKGSGILRRRDQDVRAAELQVFSRPAEVTATPSPGQAGGGPVGQPGGPVGQPGGPVGQPGQPSGGQQGGVQGAAEVCASTAGFSSARAVPRRRGLRLRFTRRESNPVTVDVFQQSRGRRLLANRRVARFTGRTRSFSWNGRGQDKKKVRDGQYFARFRMETSAGRPDVRRSTLRRRDGRFSRRPAFYRRASCGLLTSFKLGSSAFGGTRDRGLGISFRLLRRARVTLTVLRGSKVVKRYKTRSYRANRVKRLRFGARLLRRGELRRGDYRFRIRAVRGSRRVTAVLVARRL